MIVRFRCPRLKTERLTSPLECFLSATIVVVGVFIYFSLRQISLLFPFFIKINLFAVTSQMLSESKSMTHKARDLRLVHTLEIRRNFKMEILQRRFVSSFTIVLIFDRSTTQFSFPLKTISTTDRLILMFLHSSMSLWIKSVLDKTHLIREQRRYVA